MVEQRGIVLLLVLCILLLMSGIVTMSSYYWSDIYYIAGEIKKSNSKRWLLLGAEDTFLKRMTKVISNNKLTNDILPIIISSSDFMEINDNYINFSFIEQINCFNINALQYSTVNDKLLNIIYPWLVFKNILQLKNTTEISINNMDLNDNYYFYENHKINESHMISVFPDLLANELLENDKFYFDMSSIFCSRNDDKLLININMLEVKHSKLIQAILLNVINDSVISAAILSKPVNGWSSVKEFFDFIISNSGVVTEDVHKLRDIIAYNFTHDEYYFSSIFRTNANAGYYQLISLFRIKNNEVIILERRFSIGE
ncbi:general secretion pathway protein K [Yersinia frederiksenii]|uniref:hypothetical protein n=1 Tax=Yersinia frederiksenii TaxID=29484 RepID=UPI0005E8BE2F|nr:hypothetical protein [Yersinia frederiksenii]CNC61396.1 general secretion pathway protein K [Yersinia frederiksenii]